MYGGGQDSGLHKNDIEGVISVTPQAQPKIAARAFLSATAEELGLKGCKDAVSVNAGGLPPLTPYGWRSSGNEPCVAKVAGDCSACHNSFHDPLVELTINFFAKAGVDLQWEISLRFPPITSSWA